MRSKHAFHVVKLEGERNGVEAKLAGGPVEQTHVRHILMFVSDITPEADVLRRLNDIKARIERGEADFATMARLNSVDASATRGGDLGWLQKGDAVPAFEEAMMRLQPGQVSDPVKTNYGYHLIQVVERRTDKEGNPERMRIAARQAVRRSSPKPPTTGSARFATKPTWKSAVKGSNKSTYGRFAPQRTDRPAHFPRPAFRNCGRLPFPHVS